MLRMWSSDRKGTSLRLRHEVACLRQTNLVPLKLHDFFLKDSPVDIRRIFNPKRSTKFRLRNFGVLGLVAQLVRAPPCHGGGRRFESDLGRFLGIFSTKDFIVGLLMVRQSTIFIVAHSDSKIVS